MSGTKRKTDRRLSPKHRTAGSRERESVSEDAIAAAERLARVELTEAQRVQAAGDWVSSMGVLYDRLAGALKVELEPGLAPWSTWHAPQPGPKNEPDGSRFRPSAIDAGPLPPRDQDIAFAPVTYLSNWIRQGRLTSERLTGLYLDRLERFDPQLRCVITLMRDSALSQAREADSEIGAGRYRGPLHGIPWGAKDLLDTAGVPTTFGAEPFRNRVPLTDAVVVQRLREAGAILAAKLSLGGLALNDLWFGGQTMNPWFPEEGSSGSSAGSGAAVAAGLIGFSIGSETGGSIVNPCARCGAVGLRPTFGRVARTGAMTLCWSLDKLGPIARSVEDTMLVLAAISGPDAGDVCSVPCTLDYDAGEPLEGIRVGYFPAWMSEPPATDLDTTALGILKSVGMIPVAVRLPAWPYHSLNLIEFSEAAAAFEDLTLSLGLDQLKAQFSDAWPNRFRQARFLSAVDFVQTDRFRRKVAEAMAKLFENVDVLLVPSLREEMRTISNFTGHPALTVPAGFVEVTRPRSDWAHDAARKIPPLHPPRKVPHTVTFIGRPFEEGTIARVGRALESELGPGSRRPPDFDC